MSENVEPSRIDEYTLETDYDATNYLVTICDLIDGLPNQLRSFVSTKVGLLVNQQKKKEIASRKTVATTEKVIKADVNLEATSIDNVEFNQNRAHTPKANQFEQEDQQSADSKPDSDPDAPTQTSIAFQETGFLDLAKDVLSATFFELLQDSKYLMSSENPEEETEEDYENPEGMTAVYDAVRAVSLDIN